MLPDPVGRIALVNERFRAPLNRLVIADREANVIRAEMIMLPQVGGFWLREAALYDDEGICLAVASLPPSYKPELAQGSGRLCAVNMWIAVSRTSDVELIADPSVIMATAEEVAEGKMRQRIIQTRLQASSTRIFSRPLPPPLQQQSVISGKTITRRYDAIF